MISAGRLGSTDIMWILTVFGDFDPERQLVADSDRFHFSCPGVQDSYPWWRCFWCRSNAYHLRVPVNRLTRLVLIKLQRLHS